MAVVTHRVRLSQNRLQCRADLLILHYLPLQFTMNIMLLNIMIAIMTSSFAKVTQVNSSCLLSIRLGRVQGTRVLAERASQGC